MGDNNLVDAQSAVKTTSDDGSLLDAPFIFTESSFNVAEEAPSTNNNANQGDKHSSDPTTDNRAKTLMARRKGKVEAAKQLKAEKAAEKNKQKIVDDKGTTDDPNALDPATSSPLNTEWTMKHRKNSNVFFSITI